MLILVCKRRYSIEGCLSFLMLLTLTGVPEPHLSTTKLFKLSSANQTTSHPPCNIPTIGIHLRLAILYDSRVAFERLSSVSESTRDSMPNISNLLRDLVQSMISAGF